MCLIWNENAASDSLVLGMRPSAVDDSIDGLTLMTSMNSRGIGYKTGTNEYGTGL